MVIEKKKIARRTSKKCRYWVVFDFEENRSTAELHSRLQQLSN